MIFWINEKIKGNKEKREKKKEKKKKDFSLQWKNILHLQNHIECFFNGTTKLPGLIYTLIYDTHTRDMFVMNEWSNCLKEKDSFFSLENFLHVKLLVCNWFLLFVMNYTENVNQLDNTLWWIGHYYCTTSFNSVLIY